MVTLYVYFNDVPDGGGTRFLRQELDSYAPNGGRIVI